MITDDGVLIVDETFGNRVHRVRHRRPTGRSPTAASGRSSARCPTDERPATRRSAQLVGRPDGCCLDAEGALWIADAVGARLLRVREGGEVVDEIGVGTGVFACMLGGADGRTLYACAAPDFDEKARSAAREGSLIAVRVDVPHAGRP